MVRYVSEANRLGGAGNVAANLAALGAIVQAFGVVGGRKISGKKVADDEAGVALRACLQQAKIADRGVLPDPQRITTVKTRVIARHQQIVRIDRERRETLSSRVEEKLFRLLASP